MLLFCQRVRKGAYRPAVALVEAAHILRLSVEPACLRGGNSGAVGAGTPQLTFPAVRAQADGGGLFHDLLPRPGKALLKRPRCGRIEHTAGCHASIPCEPKLGTPGIAGHRIPRLHGAAHADLVPGAQPRGDAP